MTEGGPVPEPFLSFCIITDGRRPEVLRRELASIRSLTGVRTECIVAGRVPPDLGEDVHVIEAPDLADAGRLGAMRNLAVRHAVAPICVVCDDDMTFHPDFADGVATMQGDFDVLCVRLLNPDGTRFWDWATIGGPTGHRLLEYSETDPWVYVTGGLAILKRDVAVQVPWHETLGFYQQEDVEWSRRVQQAGYRIRFTPAATVTHQDDRYTQVGAVMRFRQDLARPERLTVGVSGTGVYRHGIETAKWLAPEAEVRVAPDSQDRVLRLLLIPMDAQIPDAPRLLKVAVDGMPAGTVHLTSDPVVELEFDIPTQGAVIQLRSDGAVSGSIFGAEDPRPVALLLHSASLVPVQPCAPAE